MPKSPEFNLVSLSYCGLKHLCGIFQLRLILKICSLPTTEVKVIIFATNLAVNG